MRSQPLTIATAYERMMLIRRFEERALELSADGVIAGSIHPCVGQEAIPVGALAALQPQDRVLATYRGHGWALATGTSPVALLAEIAQRAGGTNGGRAGSALLSDPKIGFLGENSIVGGGVPIANGVALASVAQNTNRVVVTSIGDGAMNQGATTEGLIFAAAKNLPVIFVLENNGWAEMTATSAMVRTQDFVQRSLALGIESHIVDGQDPFAVERAVSAAAGLCRNGQGPVLLECKTARLRGHYNKDIEHYRSQADREEAAGADPLKRLRTSAMEHGLLEDTDFDEIDRLVEEAVDNATQEVMAMALPDESSVLDHLYGQAPTLAGLAGPVEVLELTYQRAVNLALKTELKNRPEVLVYGEDVGIGGGIFGVSRGLQKEFGADRVFDTPISESAILGSAVGSALEGMRPVVEIMWSDFVFVALDQLINQAANVRYVNRSQLHAPLTVRMQQGVTPGSCAQHSQSIEAVFAHIPGLKVGLAATAQDAYDMTRAAIADPDPTVMIEFRALYQESGTVEVGRDAQLAEGARFHREGSDVAIITWGSMLGEAIIAADRLESEGVHTTVLDLRWLRPLDTAAIARAVGMASGRVVIVHEAFTKGGFGAEVSAIITGQNMGAESGSVVRLGTPDVRMPSAPNLQRALVPNAEKIHAAAIEIIGN